MSDQLSPPLNAETAISVPTIVTPNDKHDMKEGNPKEAQSSPEATINDKSELNGLHRLETHGDGGLPPVNAFATPITPLQPNGLDAGLTESHLDEPSFIQSTDTTSPTPVVADTLAEQDDAPTTIAPPAAPEVERSEVTQAIEETQEISSGGSADKPGIADAQTTITQEDSDEPLVKELAAESSPAVPGEPEVPVIGHENGKPEIDPSTTQPSLEAAKESSQPAPEPIPSLPVDAPALASPVLGGQELAGSLVAPAKASQESNVEDEVQAPITAPVELTPPAAFDDTEALKDTLPSERHDAFNGEAEAHGQEEATPADNDALATTYSGTTVVGDYASTESRKPADPVPAPIEEQEPVLESKPTITQEDGLAAFDVTPPVDSLPVEQSQPTTEAIADAQSSEDAALLESDVSGVTKADSTIGEDAADVTPTVFGLPIGPSGTTTQDSAEAEPEESSKLEEPRVSHVVEAEPQAEEVPAPSDAPTSTAPTEAPKTIVVGDYASEEPKQRDDAAPTLIEEQEPVLESAANPPAAREEDLTSFDVTPPTDALPVGHSESAAKVPAETQVEEDASLLEADVSGIHKIEPRSEETPDDTVNEVPIGLSETTTQESAGYDAKEEDSELGKSDVSKTALKQSLPEEPLTPESSFPADTSVTQAADIAVVGDYASTTKQDDLTDSVPAPIEQQEPVVDAQPGLATSVEHVVSTFDATPPVDALPSGPSETAETLVETQDDGDAALLESDVTGTAALKEEVVDETPSVYGLPVGPSGTTTQDPVEVESDNASSEPAVPELTTKADIQAEDDHLPSDLSSSIAPNPAQAHDSTVVGDYAAKELHDTVPAPIEEQQPVIESNTNPPASEQEHSTIFNVSPAVDSLPLETSDTAQASADADAALLESDLTGIASAGPTVQEQDEDATSSVFGLPVEPSSTISQESVEVETTPILSEHLPAVNAIDNTPAPSNDEDFTVFEVSISRGDSPPIRIPLADDISSGVGDAEPPMHTDDLHAASFPRPHEEHDTAVVDVPSVEVASGGSGTSAVPESQHNVIPDIPAASDAPPSAEASTAVDLAGDIPAQVGDGQVNVADASSRDVEEPIAVLEHSAKSEANESSDAVPPTEGQDLKSEIDVPKTLADTDTVSSSHLPVEETGSATAQAVQEPDTKTLEADVKDKQPVIHGEYASVEVPLPDLSTAAAIAEQEPVLEADTTSAVAQEDIEPFEVTALVDSLPVEPEVLATFGSQGSSSPVLPSVNQEDVTEPTSHALASSSSPEPVKESLAEALDGDAQDDQPIVHGEYASVEAPNPSAITEQEPVIETETTPIRFEETLAFFEETAPVESLPVDQELASSSTLPSQSGGNDEAAAPVLEDAVSDANLPEIIEPVTDAQAEVSRPASALSIRDEPNERPKSPWSPSYAVSTQGGVAVPEADIPEVESLPPSVVVSDATGANEGHLADDEPQHPTVDTNSQFERPKSPFTPSYSVVTQGSPAVKTVEIPQIKTPEDENTEQSVHQPEKVTETLASVQTVHDDNTTEPERPKSPFIPSYSVVTQGSPALKTVEIPQIKTPEDENTEQSVHQPEEVTETLASVQTEHGVSPRVDTNSQFERPKSPFTPSYSVVTQGSPALKPVEIPQIKTPEDDNTEQSVHQPEKVTETLASVQTVHDDDTAEPERPKSPLIPSYSVVTQGSPASKSVEVPQIRTPQDEIVDEPVFQSVAAAESQSSAQVETQLERPRSPWTPSYSVSSQGGSPLVIAGDLPEEKMEIFNPIAADLGAPIATTTEQEVVEAAPIHEHPTEVESLSIHDEIAPSDVRAEPLVVDPAVGIAILHDIERPKSPWGSYEVTQQGQVTPSPEAVPVASEDVTSTSADDESNPAIVASEPVAEKVTQEHEVVVPVPERPKSPWTPSYSVSQHGAIVAQEAPTNEPKDAGILSDVDVADVAPLQTNLSLPTAEAVDPVERPASPWTPSYSVTTQGGLTPTNESAPETTHQESVPTEGVDADSPAKQEPVAAVREPVIQEEPTDKVPETPPSNGPSPAVEKIAFPTNDSVALPTPSDRTLKPSLSSLAEDTVVNAVSENGTSPIAVPNSRNRVESTASSLFFPGGWFSKVPEGRASLEHAGGEFIPTSPKTTTPPVIPEAPPANDVATSSEETAEKKDRWGCVMM